MFGIFQFFSLLFPKKKQQTPEPVKIYNSVAVPPTEALMEKTNNGNPMLILPTNSLPTFERFVNDEQNKPLVFKYILNELTRAIKHDWDVVELFRVGQTPTVAKIDKENYEKTLVDLRKFFTQKEEYEHAEKCNKLIQKHNVNILTK